MNWLGLILKQVALGVAMAAGQAVVESGQQLTTIALQKKMAEWGCNLDPNSTLGVFMDNFKSNLGFQTTFLMMKATDKIFDTQLDLLRQKSQENEVAIAQKIKTQASSMKDSISGGFFSKTFWRHPLKFTSNMFSTAKAIDSISKDDLDTALSQEKANLAQAGKDFYELRKSTGSTFTGLAAGGGAYSTAYSNQQVTDDTQLFNAVMMMMNMKKVG